MHVRVLLFLLLAVAFAGCESLSDATSAVRDRIATRDESKTKIYAAPQRATYDAVRVAAAEMGYRFARGGPAQGKFEALSGVRSGDTPGSARQISMKVELKPTLDEKGTIVVARLGEIIEADSSNRAGQGMEAPLRDTPQYDVFFTRIGRVLGVTPEDERP